jgi:hypothetical protein
VQRREQGLIAIPVVSGRRAAYRASDAKLLDLVRTGITTAYDILSARHAEAARRLARIVVATAEADRVAAEAFAEVRDATLLGRGPSDAFRPYLLTVLRRVSAGLPTRDLDASDQETSPVVRAFRSLPERWIAVLWHTEIDRTPAADISRILGVEPTDVAPLRSQALDGLRRAYLEVRTSEAADPECQQAARRLASFSWGAASRRDEAVATRHLGGCGECRAMYAQFTDIEVALRGVVARTILGPAAASYMLAARRAAAQASAAGVAGRATATASAGPAGAKAPAPAGTRPPGPARESRRAPRRLRRLATGAVAALTAAAAVLLVVLAGGNTTLTPTHHGRHVETVPAPPPAVAPRPAQAPAAPPAPRPAPVDASSAQTNASLVASPTAPRARVPARLSATVDVRRSRTEFADRVVFAVGDTGGFRTGELAVSFKLPGSSLGGARFGASPRRSNGWNCQPTPVGARCRHNAIPAGGWAPGSLFISIGVPGAACGRPVSLTAVSGKATDRAQSREGIQCRRPAP